MFKRNATPRLKTAREIHALSEAEIRALGDAELDETIAYLRRGMVVREKKLHQRCADHRCRRLRSCAAAAGRCICTGLPPTGRRERKRGDVYRPRRLRI